MPRGALRQKYTWLTYRPDNQAKGLNNQRQAHDGERGDGNHECLRAAPESVRRACTLTTIRHFVSIHGSEHPEHKSGF